MLENASLWSFHTIIVIDWAAFGVDSVRIALYLLNQHSNLSESLHGDIYNTPTNPFPGSINWKYLHSNFGMLFIFGEDVNLKVRIFVTCVQILC